MSEQQKPDKNSNATEETSGELGEEQLDEVAGGIIIVNSRLQPPPDDSRVADTTLESPLLGGPDTKLTSTPS
jgi:hypothetical protein